jgi:hypothetical protein
MILNLIEACTIAGARQIFHKNFFFTSWGSFPYKRKEKIVF